MSHRVKALVTVASEASHYDALTDAQKVKWLEGELERVTAALRVANDSLTAVYAVVDATRR